ncbi:GNAT family N-acetyltransferase [Priestia taiwanensis]|uniref:Zwittermicin A resistance protein ZmaR n=1 Tax=Priestia taiwanensis TaxID=1347902 RepID=A0A917ASV6_9BACI|nr:GNAT family N-acetyltransferase [Priestia taiwanensis]MBM7363957.1 RimJ/RimL family protein N-acetyltransferase [Priestia taiwanensis]GGE70480.1 zwittermicin A resistance protein ZmaR [Priestia taiwanensis]
MIYEATNEGKKKIAPMFEGMLDTLILSCLQGHMGTAWVNDVDNPTAAQIIVGDFAFYAGDAYATGVEELLRNIPEHMLIIVDTDEWKERIEEVHAGSLDKFLRYQFYKNPEHLKKEHVQTFLSHLPTGYELVKLDTSIVHEPTLHELSDDFIARFDSGEDYVERGIGYAILHEGKVVCGAGSYSIYDSGIEIDIVTHKNHRRKGLATVAAAALIMDCLEQDKYPSWDAANTNSAKLAEKLGYVFKEAYDTYYIHTEK